MLPHPGLSWTPGCPLGPLHWTHRHACLAISSDGMRTYPIHLAYQVASRGCVSEITPGPKFRHAAYNIDMCRGKAESPKTRFSWPAWRSNYFPGMNLYYYIVPGGELCGVAAMSDEELQQPKDMRGLIPAPRVLRLLQLPLFRQRQC